MTKGLTPDFFNEYDQILIFVQKSNDLDTCSSGLALAKLIEKAHPGKFCKLVGVHIKSTYLKDLGKYCIDDTLEVSETAKKLGVLVDVNSISQIKNRKLLEKCCQILKIDHHPFDEIDVIFPEEIQKKTIDYSNCDYSSCCELLWDLVKGQKGWEIDSKITEILFMGLYADNQDFLSVKTNKTTFRVTCEMLENGANIREVIKTLRQNEFNHILLFAKVILNSTKTKNLLFMNIKAEDVYSLFPWNFIRTKTGTLRQKKTLSFPLKLARLLIKANTYIFVHYSLFDPLNSNKKFIFVYLEKENQAVERILLENGFKKQRNTWTREWTFGQLITLLQKYEQIFTN